MWDRVSFRRSGLPRRGLLSGAAPLALSPYVGAAAVSDPASGTAGIWSNPFAIKNVWAYVDKHSVVSGEVFDLMLSTGPRRDTVKGHVEFFRIVPDGTGQALVWTSSELSVCAQPVSRSAAAVGAAWPPTIADLDTKGWPPGYYSADFVQSDTGERDIRIAQIVLRNPRRSGRILLKISTNTYQAYNDWGGYSVYPSEDESGRGNVVSFDRPTPPEFFVYEVYLARWLEALGVRTGFGVDYATNFDLHKDPTLTFDYPLVLSGSHDEYWSRQEFEAFHHRIFSLGRNVIFFGGNVAYFQVRYADINRLQDGEDRGRLMVCYKRLNDPIVRRGGAVVPLLDATAQFRAAARRPETMLGGVAYQSWFPADPAEGPTCAYRVNRMDVPFFAGTDYKVGDIAAEVVGYEWDNRDPDGDGHRLWDPSRSQVPLLDEDRIKVLFRGEPVDIRGRRGNAEAVYFESPAGAKVFSAGSIRWAWGLGKQGFTRESFTKFNENLITAFLQAS